MSKGKAIVSLDGKILEVRRTNRPYQFALVARFDDNRAKRYNAGRNLAIDKVYLKKYEEVLRTGVVPAEYRGSSTLADYERYRAQQIEGIAKWEDILATTPDEEKSTAWAVQSYHGNHNLAAKAMNTLLSQTFHHTLEVKIVPVEFVDGKK